MKILKHLIAIIILVLTVYMLINASLLYQKINFSFNKQKLTREKNKIIDYKLYRNNTIIIPQIGLEAPIIFPKEQNEHIILESLKTGIVHFPYTAKPGQPNNSVLIGHSANFWWNRGDFNTIFANLNKIKKDDPIFVVHKNKLHQYLVTEKIYINTTDLSILNQNNQSTITLLTCWPLGSDIKRLAIIGRLSK